MATLYWRQEFPGYVRLRGGRLKRGALVDVWAASAPATGWNPAVQGDALGNFPTCRDAMNAAEAEAAARGLITPS